LSLTLQDIASELGLQTEKKGSDRTDYFCPVHDNKSGDLSLYPGSHFACHGQGGSSPATLVMHCKDWNDTTKAAEWIQEHFPDEVEDVDEETIDRRKQARQVLNKATELAKDSLEKQKNRLREDIKDKRNFDDEIMEEAKIGFLSQGDTELLESRFDRQSLIDSGLFVETDDGVFSHLQNRIIFPYMRGDQTYFMIGRKLPDSDSDAKYKKTNVTDYNKHILYEFSDGKADEIVITEGVTDAISAWRSGLDVVSPVTTRFREKDIDKVKSRVSGYDRVYLVNDNDEAGQEGAEKTARQLTKDGNEPILVDLEVDDLDDYTTENGYDLRELLDDGKYYLQTLFVKYEEASRVEKQKIKEEVFELVRDWPMKDRQIVWDSMPGNKSNHASAFSSFCDKNPSDNEANEANEANVAPEAKEKDISGTHDDFVDSLIEEEKAKTIRMSGAIGNPTSVHTVFLRRGRTEKKFCLLYEDGFQLKEVKNKLKEMDKERRENMNEEQRNIHDYYFFKNKGQEIRYQHKPIKVGSNVKTATNSVLSYALKDKQVSDNLLSDIKQQIKKYWDHPEDSWYTVLAAWVIHTYLLQDLSITPYIFLTGKADTGKSVCQSTLHQMSYNSYMMENATVASTERAIHFSQATVHMDEMDKLSEEETQKIQKSANSGYQNASKRTIVNTNKDDVEDQIEEFFTYSSKTFAANGLYNYDDHMLTRSFIINSVPASRVVEDIRDLDKEQEERFKQIRNQLFVYSLKNRMSLLDDVESSKSQIEASNRKKDKFAVIHGIIKHFKTRESADEVVDFLEDQNKLSNEEISDADRVLLEQVVSRTEDDGLACLVKELRDDVNLELGRDNDSEFSLSSKGVVRKLMNYSVIRQDRHKKRTSQGMKVMVERSIVVEALHRHDLSELVHELDGGEDGESVSEKTENKDRSATSASSASSASSPEKIEGKYTLSESSVEDLVSSNVDNYEGGVSVEDIVDHFEAKYNGSVNVDEKLNEIVYGDNGLLRNGVLMENTPGELKPI